MCVCVCACVCVSAHVYLYMCAHSRVKVLMYECLFLRICGCMSFVVYVLVYHSETHILSGHVVVVCVCLCVCLCVCVCVCGARLSVSMCLCVLFGRQV